MVNPYSPAFKFSEKIGLIINKGIRYILVGKVIVFLDGKLVGSKPYPSVSSLTLEAILLVGTYNLLKN
jgi:hypothetical protein